MTLWMQIITNIGTTKEENERVSLTMYKYRVVNRIKRIALYVERKGSTEKITLKKLQRSRPNIGKVRKDGPSAIVLFSIKMQISQLMIVRSMKISLA
jgi:hypothetical protein